MADATPLATDDTLGAPIDPAAPTQDGARSLAVSVDTHRRMGRYLLLEKLGAGGMGVVWAAYDPELDRRVAVKLIAAEQSSDSARRFVREARAMAQLHHRAIATVHDVGIERDTAYIAMELVRGVTISRWIAGGPHPWRTIVAKFVQAGHGLAAAHDAGVVHRDFKPSNVMIDEDGRVVVLDFGLARAPSRPGEDHAPPIESRGANAVGDVRSGSWSSTAVTQQGGIVGTPAYMAPEQLGGGTFDGRTDQFAFCVALYEALYGVPPFPRRALGELLDAIAAGRLTPPAITRHVPARIRRAIARGLRESPAERWPDMRALLHELSRDPARTAAWVAGAVAVIGTSTWAIATRHDPCADLAAEIDRVWSPERRERVVVAAAQRERDAASARDVDTYVARLAAVSEQACSATDTEGGHRDAMTCVSAATTELDGILLVIEAPGGAPREASSLVWSLAEPESCVREDRRQAEEPMPAEDVRDLVEAHASLLADDDERAEMLVTALRERTVNGSDSWNARLLRVEGRIALARQSFVEGIAKLTESATISLRVDDELGFVSTALDLGEFYGRQRGDIALARTWLALARAAIDRLGGAPALRIALLQTEGAVLQIDGLPDDSIRVLSEARALADTTFGSEHRLTGSAIGTLATAQMIRGRCDLAVPLFEETIRVATHWWGANHHVVLRAQSNIVTCLIESGHLEEGKRANEALDRAMVDGGFAGTAEYAGVQIVWADIAMREERWADAIPRYEVAYALLVADDTQLRAAAVRARTAMLRSRLGEHDRARTELEEARKTMLVTGIDEAHPYLRYLGLYLIENELNAGFVELAASKLGEVLPRLPDDLALQHHAALLRGRIALQRPQDAAPAQAHIAARLALAGTDWPTLVELMLVSAEIAQRAGDHTTASASLALARRELVDREHPFLTRQLERLEAASLR